MAEETLTQATETQQDKPTKMKCPCCGEMTLNRPPDIKSAVLDEYMASIISGVPFAHTYTIYSTVDITVSVLSKQQSRTMYVTLQMLDKLIKSHNIADPKLLASLSELYGCLQLYSAIPMIRTYKDKRLQKEFTPSQIVFESCDKLLKLQHAIEVYFDPEVAVLEDADNIDVLEALNAIYADCCNEEELSSLPDVMLRAIVRTHNDIYNILMETGFDANFWKGIELA